MAGDVSLTNMPAYEVVDLLNRGTVSPFDCLEALEARITAVDGAVNALPTLCFDRARDQARRLMQLPLGNRGRLAGLPVPIKDLTDVAGVRTTYGSTIFAEYIPETSDILVETIEAEGGVIYAKSNTPEFGAGGNTFNEVFGATLNPWNTRLSAAGSSGGAAVALATGTAWVAQGSDLGGSLRNPASFCGVVGLRPSPGRVASNPGAKIDRLLGVKGPMGRSVEDTALLLDAMTGESPADPVSLPRSEGFLAAARSGWRPARVAFSADLGITPVDPEVASICRTAAARFSEMGVVVEEAHPDLSKAHDTFQVMRGVAFATSYAGLLERHRDKMKPEVVWNIEKGLSYSIADLVRAENDRAAMLRQMNLFFDSYDLLLCPATIVAAYPVGERYVKECAGHTFTNYVEWLAIAYAITLTTSPALSLPCGFTNDGRPVGLQIVGRPRSDGRVLAGARALELILNLRSVTPIDPRSPT
ncbi:amidase [Phyllobacterium brassicacearum]|uniref:Amidase n=1 Tax=Phyllobacterium brassicacearum TaxID=314235 RepID=A0A2P7BUR5_9HYPH|nr:amidase family protein [Phyllobacterium brassicacearum]PSH70142.1 amidase [Phyllobacterium brassicacearum]TDQ33988.1 amidase [Phyllobacterium brassicacearum]